MENWQNMICRFQMAVSETEKGEFDLLVSKFQPFFHERDLPQGKQIGVWIFEIANQSISS